MHARCVLCLAAIAALLGPASGLAATSLDIVDRAIAHHGGGLYRATESRLEVCSLSGCSALRVRREGGLFEYEVSGRWRELDRRVWMTNDEVRLWHDGERQEIAPDDEAALRDWAMARIYFPFLPSRLDDPGVRLQDLGSETWDGRELRKVRVSFAAGTSTDDDDVFLYWFDPRTARLEQLAYSYRRNGGGLRFRRAVDHRRFGGILFFDQENFGVEGPGLDVERIDPRFVAERMRHVSTLRLKDIEVHELAAAEH